MGELRIDGAILAGLKVNGIDKLGDVNMAFEQIPEHFRFIAETLRWQTTDVASEEFLNNQLCYFVDRRDHAYFCLESNYSETNKGKFAYYLEKSFFGTSPGYIFLTGSLYMDKSEIENQLESRGFILWMGNNVSDTFEKNYVMYGTFRHFYPDLKVVLSGDDAQLQCKFNRKKGVKYLKLLLASYVERLFGVFDVLPSVLLDIVAVYVMGEF
ncbi:MAG: hypothetical protein Harvfovirus3_28 [Harvfovirus sp.]|uniref:Uncharacterized protein n=1 Tax=Harvfovirus sp. TaxID=2487768 RepID=A0A3G5A439_9VIRU|nr:MAG: hypothetical protein Harvfovirus3_28 [Harvfovirus sp.]